MLRAYDVRTVRAAEAACMARLPEGALMERAAAGLVSTVVDLLGGAYGARIVLLVGSGDNGGDALLAGARLARRGARVDALLLSRPSHPHAATLRAHGGRLHDADDETAASVLSRADLVIDGIVGIGGRGGLRPAAAELVARVPREALVVAVDLPSGVEADSGEVDGPAVTADVTVCMGVLKPALLIDPAAARAGAVRVVDIGLDMSETPIVEALTDDDVDARLGDRGRDADKYSGGVVGIVAGSPRYPGAAVLCVAGALASGAGYVRFIGDTGTVDAVRGAFPEVVCTEVDADTSGAGWVSALEAAGRVQAWIVGPGSGTDDRAHERVAAVLQRPEPVLVDADALTCLADDLADGRRLQVLLASRTAPTLLTPHAGELARLIELERSDVEARRLASVARAADLLAATVLLKGSTTLVAAPETGTGRPPVMANLTGTAALATAGSGDVLSGLCGALLARGWSARDAGAVGAHLHGRAGVRAADSAEGGLAVTAPAIAAALGIELRGTDPQESGHPVG